MNFLSHGHRYIGLPYLLAGTAVPDWLSYIDRRIRARRALAEQFVEDVDPCVANVARGIVQHHVDDHRFHGSRIFVEMSMQFALAIRDRLPNDDGLRPSFVGHIIIEMLLDSHLHDNHVGLLDRYYQALASIRADTVEAAVNRITGKPTDRMARLIAKFCGERFLYDYVDDSRLLHRLNQVMRRVGLDQLPDSLLPFIAGARDHVSEHAPLLLPSIASA